MCFFNISIVFLCSLFQYGLSFVAYDCGGSFVNLTTLSLVSDTKCDDIVPLPSITPITIQLLQRSDNEYTHITQCKVKVSRVITYCGMHSHSSTVQNGFANYIYEVGKEGCYKMHSMKTLHLINNNMITGLQSNSTFTTTITMAGKTRIDGTCIGAMFSDQFGSWENVVVQAAIEITLLDFTTTYATNTNILHLPSGVRCKYSVGHCMDIDGGETWWQPVQQQRCSSFEYDVLYQGRADQIIEQNSFNPMFNVTTYLVNTEDIVFGLTITKQVPVCGTFAYQTQHPKLLIMINTGQGFLFEKRKLSSLNTDLFTYINSKFIYVEKHIHRQLEAMYKDLNQQRCRVEAQVLQNHMALAILNPTEFAYVYMQMPGYTARSIGELVHVIKCHPVDVSYRKSRRCFNELPVLYNNKSFFMTPRSHLLQEFGTEISCNDLIHNGFLLHGHWYSFTPNRNQIPNPTELTPLRIGTWTYKNPYNLEKAGIYTQEDLDDLRSHIMYPLERSSVTNIITRGLMGIDTDPQNPQGGLLLTEMDIKKVSDNILKKTWGVFKDIGTVSSGIMGIYCCFLLFKYILSMLLNGWTLYKILGCGLHLLASLMDSCTSFFISRNINSVHKSCKTDDDTDDIVVTQPSCPSLIYPVIPVAPKDMNMV